jgi:hypothetical protein
MPVYNLSVGGWGPESYRAAYHKFAKDRNAKVVVVFSFNNDITDVDNWRRWQASGSNLPFKVWLWQNDPSIVNLKNWWIDRRLILWNITKMAINKVRYHQGESTGSEYFSASGEKEPFRLQFTKGYQFMALNPDAFSAEGAYWPYMLAYFESLDRLRADIESQGSEMLLVWIPAKERVYLPLLAEDKYREYVTNSSGEIDGLERVLHLYAKERNFRFFDLTPELIRRASEGQKLYFTVDGHLNSLGNQVVGELTAAVIGDILEEIESRP